MNDVRDPCCLALSDKKSHEAGSDSEKKEARRCPFTVKKAALDDHTPLRRSCVYPHTLSNKLPDVQKTPREEVAGYSHILEIRLPDV